MEVSIVVAAAENDVIGRTDGSIPWRIRTDIRHFRDLTMGHPIIMGRKTYETFRRPLPGRVNIVITRNTEFEAEGCTVVHNGLEALDAAAKSSGADEVFVIGGGQIYIDLLPQTSTLYLTRVHAQPEGEAHFRFNAAEWKEVNVEHHPADAEKENEYPFTFLTLKRIDNVS